MSRDHKIICESCGQVFTFGQFVSGLRCHTSGYYGEVDGRGGIGVRELSDEVGILEHLDIIVKVVWVDAETFRLAVNDFYKVELGDGLFYWGMKVLMDGCILVKDERDEQ